METKILLNRKEAAKYLGLHHGTLRVWASTGRYNLPYYKVGGAVRYNQKDLDEFLIRQLFKQKKGEESTGMLSSPNVNHHNVRKL